MADYFDHPAVSYHDLLLIDDPSVYYRQKIRGERRPQESYETLGQAYHALTLEGDAGLARDFVVVPEDYLTDSGRVSTSKTAKAWLASVAPRKPLDPKDYNTVLGIARAVKAHGIAATLLRNGRPEVEHFWTDPTTRIDCKLKCDWVNDDAVVDLKGTRSLDGFPADIVNFGYIDQLTWYGDALKKRRRYILAVEKQAPYRVGVWVIPDECAPVARQRLRARLEKLSACLQSDDWSSPYAKLQTAPVIEPIPFNATMKVAA